MGATLGSTGSGAAAIATQLPAWVFAVFAACSVLVALALSATAGTERRKRAEDSRKAFLAFRLEAEGYVFRLNSGTSPDAVLTELTASRRKREEAESAAPTDWLMGGKKAQQAAEEETKTWMATRSYSK